VAGLHPRREVSIVTHSIEGAPGCESLIMTDMQAALAAEIHMERGSDAEEQAELTQRLRTQLVELDVDDVRLAPGQEAPSGAKGPELLGVGALIVEFVLRPDTLRSVVGTVSAWVGRQRARAVRLTLDGDTLEVTGISSAHQSQLIEQWIARHADAG
jgi:hypothetical protein